jgi:peptide/nickel transport system permease protein
MVITFLVSRVMVPDPARAWAGSRASPDTIAALTVRFHLHDPIYVQFYYYLSDLLHGDWGVSPSSGQPVLYSILIYLPATVELTIAALFLIVVIGIPLGVVAATHRNKAVDHLARITALSGVASPPFLAALLLQFVFFYYLRVFPDSGGRISVFVQSPPSITGLLTVDSLITGNMTAFVSALQHLVMPAFALAFLTLGLMSRLVRASMLETLASDYVRTAKAKGLKKRIVTYKHALKNALIQPITALSVYVAYLLGGSVVIELIFSWPGIGRYAAQAALDFDLPAVMGTTLAFTIGVIFANLVADVLYAVLDPRISLR